MPLAYSLYSLVIAGLTCCEGWSSDDFEKEERRRRAGSFQERLDWDPISERSQILYAPPLSERPPIRKSSQIKIFESDEEKAARDGLKIEKIRNTYQQLAILDDELEASRRHNKIKKTYDDLSEILMKRRDHRLALCSGDKEEDGWADPSFQGPSNGLKNLDDFLMDKTYKRLDPLGRPSSRLRAEPDPQEEKIKKSWDFIEKVKKLFCCGSRS